jgi:hypothetical protein
LGRELFTATEYDSPCRQHFYRGMHSVLVTLYSSPQRGTGATLLLSGEVRDKLHGRCIRDIFGLEEEACALLTVRKHLLGLYGHHIMYSVVSPGCHPPAVLNHNNHVVDILPPSLERAPALPEFFEVEDDVGPSLQLEARDVVYYEKLCQMLDMEDSLKEVSVFTSMCDVFTFPNEPSSSQAASSSSDEDSSAASSRGHSCNDSNVPFRKEGSGKKHRFTLRQRIVAKGRA